MAPTSLALSGHLGADQLLVEDPLALLIGMVLDQQIPLERAFRSPFDLKERLGGVLDPAQLAAMDPEELAAVFAQPPALHRFPSSMATRVQQLCRVVLEDYQGRAGDLWATASTGEEMLARTQALPGFGQQKARIFVALLGKQLGVTPPGWREAAEPYGAAGSFMSVADIDGPEALSRVRQHKATMKTQARAAAMRAAATEVPGTGPPPTSAGRRRSAPPKSS